MFSFTRVIASLISFDGLISPERARDVYGVVVGPEGRPADELELDEAATAKLRKERKAATRAGRPA